MRLPTIQELGVLEDNPPLYRPIPIYPVHMKARQADHIKSRRTQTRNSVRPYCVSQSGERNSPLWTKIPRSTTETKSTASKSPPNDLTSLKPTESSLTASLTT